MEVSTPQIPIVYELVLLVIVAVIENLCHEAVIGDDDDVVILVSKP